MPIGQQTSLNGSNDELLRSKHRSSPSLLARFLWGVRDFGGQVTSSLELSCHYGNIIFSPDQIQELCKFIEEAKDQRERRIPELEGCLEEMRAALEESTWLCARLQDRIKALEKESSLEKSIETGLNTLSIQNSIDQEDKLEAQVELNKDEIPLETIRRQAPSPESKGSIQLGLEELLRLREQVQKLTEEKSQLRDTICRYETAIALHKGDRHMLLTDVLRQVFSSPSYQTLKLERDPMQSTNQHVGCETDFAEPPSKLAKEDDNVLQADTMPVDEASTILKIGIAQSQMMQGCWMYKYPRRRYDSLIYQIGVPISRLTFRFFWFCPLSGLVMWSTKSSYDASTSKIIKVQDVIFERRKLNSTGDTELIIIKPKIGKPLALVPTNCTDMAYWREVNL